MVDRPHLFMLRNRHFLLLDVIFSILSVVLSFSIRLETTTFDISIWRGIALFLCIALPLRLIVFRVRGLYSRYWVNAGPSELLLVASACLVSGLIVTLLFTILIPLAHLGSVLTLPRTIPMIDALLGSVLVMSLRFAPRAYYHQRSHQKHHPTTTQERVLIIGAGQTGIQLLDTLEKASNHQIVGFLDDDPLKVGTYVRGVKVLDKIDNLTTVADTYTVSLVAIAVPSAPGTFIRRIVAACSAGGLAYKIIPGMGELVSGKIRITALRPVAIDDLLRRAPVHLDVRDVEGQIHGQCVLVTGGGGSIGSELARQIAIHHPRHLLLLGHGENSLFAAENRLKDEFPGLSIKVILADIRDSQRLNQVFEQWHPQVVFHAAAHKHVPMLETNAAEAVANNVIGTQNLIDLCNKFEVRRMVAISTDKAVKPTNIMGMTKRVSELIMIRAAQTQPHRFAAVRFGNVLGSRGSVVPIFQAQIAAGGPITITNDKMTRFFMSIPEAARLVLKASVLTNRGPLFVLNMGDPIRILDLAYDLIRLNGLEPERDIEIKITGSRPGEKMHEELHWEYEIATPVENGAIFSIQRHKAYMHPLVASLPTQLEALLGAAKNYDDEAVRHWLHEIVYAPPQIEKDAGETVTALSHLSALAEQG
jgi:FlaA1/EpsC-like NDP-sugar epimerase